MATSSTCAIATAQTPFRLGVVGLVHGHVTGFFGQALKRPEVRVVGIAEPSRELFDKYSRKYDLSDKLYFSSLEQMLSVARPDAVVLYTNTFDHRHAVEICAKNHIPVMMEKPLAVSYADALAMSSAAAAGHIHVLVNYETTWYASNKAAYDLLRQGDLGVLKKLVFRDGHQGPREIGVQPEFFDWLTNPKLDGAGALYDFGCYGADLATWIMNGQAPSSVTAVTLQIKPDIYPRVDDEADVVLTYPKAVAILQPSWNWSYSIKDMEVYGTNASTKTMLRDKLLITREGHTDGQLTSTQPLQSPYDDSLHYFAAIVRGEISDPESSLSSLKTNVIVSEILDAARQSSQSGRTVVLPLK
ncbi:MAG TPA: Gfo/Idh/MocA family oxidoreductase [Bryobacteraceae bacterium]|nr:Gfo/Idh/MocA family oxidoreductase [Bryobacteraceae bacterium]